ncbi:MAG: hypothetical protein IJ593_03685, partial [Lachnospiraceae bacterium]|nr:hypothetical protein [Lachnospiraceae bacterium]
MKKEFFSKFWKFARKKISEVLVVSFVVTGISPATTIYAKETHYQFVDEMEVDDTLIDDGMFYMPYSSLDVNENDENNKYVFKVKRKGEELKEDKVRLTMIDMSSKYDRDYSIRVIDKALFSENVKNKTNSKSVNEHISKSNYDEYNYSDAIVDGTIKSEDIMTDEEIENFKMSDGEKVKAISDANAIINEYGYNGNVEEVKREGDSEKGEVDIDSAHEEENEIETETEAETEIEIETETEAEAKTVDETIKSFSNTQNEDETVKETLQNDETTFMEEKLTNESTDEETENETDSEADKEAKAETEIEKEVETEEESEKVVENETEEESKIETIIEIETE